MLYKYIYEEEETGNALYDFCTGCQKPVKQEDLGDGSFGCEFCKSSNSIEIREVECNEKRIIKIFKDDFIDWFYNEKDDLIELANGVKNIIKKENIFSITLEDIFNSVGYIPQRFIKNKDELQDLIFDEEFAEPQLADLKVEWV